MQFDLFEHSRDVMLRNGVAEALERDDAAAARTARDELAREYADDELLALSLRLVEVIERAAAPPLPDHEGLRRERVGLDELVAPAARRVLGEPAARAWLARRWQELARRAITLTFDGDHADEHAAALWLRAGDWTAAEGAAAAIASWRRIPAPLAWMAQARLHGVGLQATWPLLAELAWLAPARFGDVARRAPDPQLPRLLGDFERGFEGEGDARDLAWFPAWLLTERPALREHLAAAQSGQHTAAEQALRTLVELLGLEQQGRHHDIVARRKALRDLQPSLYASYMRTR